MLTKDGKSVPAGGAGLAEMVAGNPGAEEHVRSLHASIRLGIAEQLIGLGALIAGASWSRPNRT